jgi:hypothetical protein
VEVFDDYGAPQFHASDDQPSPKIAAFVQACGAQCELEILIQDDECAMRRSRDPRLSGEKAGA